MSYFVKEGEVTSEDLSTDAAAKSDQAYKTKKQSELAGLAAMKNRVAVSQQGLQDLQGAQEQSQLALRRKVAQAMAGDRARMGYTGGGAAQARGAALERGGEEAGIMAKYAQAMMAQKDKTAQMQQEYAEESAKYAGEQLTEQSTMVANAQKELAPLIEKENNAWTSDDDEKALYDNMYRIAGTLPEPARTQFLSWAKTAISAVV